MTLFLGVGNLLLLEFDPAFSKHQCRLRLVARQTFFLIKCYASSTMSKTRHLLRVFAALFTSALSVVSKALAALAGLMLLVIVGVVFVGVFCRYALHMGLGWTEEAARFLLIGLTFVAATVAVDRWSHFQLAIASSWLPPRYQRPLQLFSTIIVLIMSAGLVRYGIDVARISWNQTSPMMGWSMGYLYLIVPVSAALMFLFALRHLIEVLKGGTLPNPLASHGKSEDTSPANPAADI